MDAVSKPASGAQGRNDAKFSTLGSECGCSNAVLP